MGIFSSKPASAADIEVHLAPQWIVVRNDGSFLEEIHGKTKETPKRPNGTGIN